MKLKLGKAYQHEAGRRIHVIGEVTTQAWGQMFVIEEKDHTGSGISCIAKNDEFIDDNWTETGIEEWKQA